MLNLHLIPFVIKVDDMVGEVSEYLEGGCWTVGLAKYSNDITHLPQVVEDINRRLYSGNKP